MDRRMKCFFSLFIFLFVCRAHGFTLVSSRLKFPVTEVTVNVAGNSCSNNGITTDHLLDLAEQAVDEFWNQVPTSKMKLKRGAVLTSIDVSSDTLSLAMVKVSGNSILVGCSGNTTTFDSASTLGVGNIAQLSSGAIIGALLINDALVGGSNRVASMPDSELRPVVAHEIGHALGIGHSGDPIALMYYAVGAKVQEKLSQDDYDAISYLYPHPSPGGCGSISSKDVPPTFFVATLCLGLLLPFMLISISTGSKRVFVR